ncbi:hypothetical protein BN6_65390 [Saccharothrix espanaensis DSM 44229]|uniref:Anti-sigma factor antagonist n=1 Tax=Saccharothrix espanaensis (strain ATCC 51144 / DSM 44229 / JCM 9112 / NBRC 15066 / NRRL 15764) TaxID=1179773 RepID=K0KAX5_SACES|nr:hypothetical protein BN6_65390 [Saccharothrix espanaensis DSM 44229]
MTQSRTVGGGTPPVDVPARIPPSAVQDHPGVDGFRITVDHAPHRRCAMREETGVPEPSAALASVQVDRSDGVVVLRVSGELDASSADELARPLKSALVDGVRGVVVDLTQVRFLGSAGLESLVTGSKRADGLGVPLLVVAVGRAVLRPIEATGLTAVFTLAETLEEALGRI